MKQQHTPGPWRTSEENNVWTDSGQRVANVTNENEANARLIASAPELLEALEGALSMLELLNAPGTHDPVEARVYAARTAIAKAKGEK